MTRSILLAVIALISSTAHAGLTLEGPDCLSAPLSPQLQRWARMTLDSATQGVTLDNGTIIDHTCLDGLNDHDRAQRLARLDAAVQFASQQATTCNMALHLPDPTNVPGTLAHLRLKCAVMDKKYGATTEQYTTVQQEGLLGGPLATTHIWDHSYVTTLNIAGGTDLRVGRINNLASDLFHEVLHYYSNNRAWHDDPYAAHTDLGCQNSIFTDRVYFTQAACFPLSDYGQSFYGTPGSPSSDPAASCGGICDAALGEVDSNSTEVTHAPYYYGGRHLVANPLSQGDRNIICNDVVGNWNRFKGAYPEGQRVATMVAANLNTLPQRFRDDTWVARHIQDLERYMVTNGQLRAVDQADAQAELAHTRDMLLGDIQRFCLGPADQGDRWPDGHVPTPAEKSDLCISGPIRIRGAVDDVSAYLHQFHDSDFLLLRSIPDPAPDS